MAKPHGANSEVPAGETATSAVTGADGVTQLHLVTSSTVPEVSASDEFASLTMDRRGKSTSSAEVIEPEASTTIAPGISVTVPTPPQECITKKSEGPRERASLTDQVLNIIDRYRNATLASGMGIALTVQSTLEGMLASGWTAIVFAGKLATILYVARKGDAWALKADDAPRKVN